MKAVWNTSEPYRSPNRPFRRLNKLSRCSCRSVTRCDFGGSDLHFPQPENRHVKFNVDVKVQNDPARLFPLMHSIISAHDQWETLLAPRILLGLWHPRFLSPAKILLPYCRRSYIGHSPVFAKKYFWNSCDVFSMSFGSLTTVVGEKCVCLYFW